MSGARVRPISYGSCMGSTGGGAAVLDEERRLLRALTWWAGLSVVAGVAGRGARRCAGASSEPVGLVPGLARQAISWGVVDLAIVAWGRRGLRRAATVPLTDADAAARAARMARVVGVNAVLDVGYVAAGVALTTRSRRRRGDGLGVVVQGLALLWLDSRHGLAFRRLTSPVPDRDAGGPP